MYYQSLKQIIKMLSSFQNILTKTEQYAEAKKFDSAVLLNSRLAPDQFPLSKQIQTFCDMSKFMAARLSSKEAPKHDDNEKTLGELKDRIGKVIDYLNGFNPSDFENIEDKKIELAFRPGLYLSPEDYLIEFVLPNVYFHLTTAYQILRHNGLEIGKLDYLGSVNFKKID
ncbi:MAG: DUF1993 domain-containing protein [Cyanobacteriota bacterium]